MIFRYTHTLHHNIYITIITIIIIILYHRHHHSDGAHLKPLSQFQRWENEKMNVTHIITLDVPTNLTASLENGSRLTLDIAHGNLHWPYAKLTFSTHSY